MNLDIYLEEEQWKVGIQIINGLKMDKLLFLV